MHDIFDGLGALFLAKSLQCYTSRLPLLVVKDIGIESFNDHVHKLFALGRRLRFRSQPLLTTDGLINPALNNFQASEARGSDVP